jgi:hypothetical protein
MSLLKLLTSCITNMTSIRFNTQFPLHATQSSNWPSSEQKQWSHVFKDTNLPDVQPQWTIINNALNSHVLNYMQ